MSWTACSTFTPLFFLQPLSASLKPLLSKPSLTPLLLISPRSLASCLPPLTHYALYKHTSDKRSDVDCVVINTGREFRLVLVMSGVVYTKDTALKVQQLVLTKAAVQDFNLTERGWAETLLQYDGDFPLRSQEMSERHGKTQPERERERGRRREKEGGTRQKKVGEKKHL